MSKKSLIVFLIDAPCSGSGLMQKKPEMLVVEKDISSLIKNKKMLLKASELVKDGGYIFYCVCSLLNQRRRKSNYFLFKKSKCFSAINIFADVSEFGKLLKSNTFLVTPYSFKNQGGVDGFFMACLMKKSNLI